MGPCAGQLHLVMTNMQFLKPREVGHRHVPKNGVRDFLTTRRSPAAGLIELGEDGFQPNARGLHSPLDARDCHRNRLNPGTAFGAALPRGYCGSSANVAFPAGSFSRPSI